MGCHKLTYDFEPTLFVQEQGEKNCTAELKVWSSPDTTFGEVGAIVLNSAGGYQEGLKILSAQLWTADAGFFTMDAYAEYRLATNNAIRTNFTRATGYYWNPGALKNSDKFFKALKIGASALGKVTFGLGVAASLYSVYQKPTVENAAWAAADITVGAIGLGSGAIATWAGTVGLAIPGLNVIIAGGALAYAGYRLYQAYKDDN